MELRSHDDQSFLMGYLMVSNYHISFLWPIIYHFDNCKMGYIDGIFDGILILMGYKHLVPELKVRCSSPELTCIPLESSVAQGQTAW